MAYKYRGADRRTMKQTARDLLALLTRDQVALNPKYTTKLSTRALILVGSLQGPAPTYTPLTPTPGSIAAMATAVYAALEAELAETV